MSGTFLQTVSVISQVSGPVAGPLSGTGILALCVLGAVGLGLLLPSRRGATLRRVGGALLSAAGLIFLLVMLRFAARAGLWGTGAWAGETGVYFWAFSAISLVSAVRVITHTRPVYSALYFVMAVFSSAGLFVLLNAQFMAAALVLIYAGAVLVTYVFVIMLASESSGGSATASVTAGAEVDAVSRDPFLAGAVGFTLMAVLLMAVFDLPSFERIGRYNAVSTTEVAVADDSTALTGSVSTGAFGDAPVVKGDVQQLGQYLFQDQMLAVQAAMLVLTLAMTGAVIIARRRVYVAAPPISATTTVLTTPSTPSDDNPHSIPIYGTDNPRAKEYPQT